MTRSGRRRPRARNASGTSTRRTRRSPRRRRRRRSRGRTMSEKGKGRGRVFFPVQSPQFDVTAALDYGEVLYLIKSDNLSHLNTEVVSRIIRRELEGRQFDPMEDFVGFTGPMIAVATLFGLVFRRYGMARCLLFDATT